MTGASASSLNNHLLFVFVDDSRLCFSFFILVLLRVDGLVLDSSGVLLFLHVLTLDSGVSTTFISFFCFVLLTDFEMLAPTSSASLLGCFFSFSLLPRFSLDSLLPFPFLPFPTDLGVPSVWLVVVSSKVKSRVMNCFQLLPHFFNSYTTNNFIKP
jgi:hypothetical protein